MKIYKIITDPSNCGAYFLNSNDELVICPGRYFHGKNAKRVFSARKFQIKNFRESKPYADFVEAGLGAVLVSERCKEIINTEFPNEVDFSLSLLLKRRFYYLLNPKNLCEFVDMDKSLFLFRSHSEVDFGHNLKIRVETLPDSTIFKHKLDPQKLFVKESFVKLVIDNCLTGIAFEDPELTMGIRGQFNVVEGLPFK